MSGWAFRMVNNMAFDQSDAQDRKVSEEQREFAGEVVERITIL